MGFSGPFSSYPHGLRDFSQFCGFMPGLPGLRSLASLPLLPTAEFFPCPAPWGGPTSVC